MKNTIQKILFTSAPQLLHYRFTVLGGSVVSTDDFITSAKIAKLGLLTRRMHVQEWFSHMKQSTSLTLSDDKTDLQDWILINFFIREFNEVGELDKKQTQMNLADHAGNLRISGLSTSEGLKMYQKIGLFTQKINSNLRIELINPHILPDETKFSPIPEEIVSGDGIDMANSGGLSSIGESEVTLDLIVKGSLIGSLQIKFKNGGFSLSINPDMFYIDFLNPSLPKTVVDLYQQLFVVADALKKEPGNIKYKQEGRRIFFEAQICYKTFLIDILKTDGRVPKFEIDSHIKLLEVLKALQDKLSVRRTFSLSC